MSAETPKPPEPPGHARSEPIAPRRRRLGIERFLTRVMVTAGIIGIGVAIAAIMHSQKSQGWLIGFVVSIVSVILAAFVWSSRRL
ncbi:MAG TPA: hypothetical protein VG321_05800 [Solirubrobacteraceae bacterium]|nr:hypothetical protein [Solirubrobacteraceae bacterium]